MMATFYDVILVITLIVMAWKLLRTSDLFVNVVLYIIFGLLSVLAWVELQAPDIALVEAAVGAGVTGALFLAVLGQMEARTKLLSVREKPGPSENALWLWLPASAIAGIAGWCLWHLPRWTFGLKEGVYGQLDKSGAKNPVTAVILNFRSYDTLLEIGVLFLVVVAIYALKEIEGKTLPFKLPPRSRILIVFLHLIIPLMVMAAVYLLWIGKDMPGGAFQAGSILAGAGILLILGRARFMLKLKVIWLRLALVCGFAGFLLTGVGVMRKDRHFLEYPPELAHPVIVMIEILSTLSVGFILLALFAACANFLKSDDEKQERAVS